MERKPTKMAARPEEPGCLVGWVEGRLGPGGGRGTHGPGHGGGEVAEEVCGTRGQGPHWKVEKRNQERANHPHPGLATGGRG